MNQYAISTPEGSRDRLFAATRLFRQNERRIRNVLEERGYDEIITPSLEYYDVFVQAGSSIGQEKMYKLTDRNGRLLVLRPDNTTPIARVGTTKRDDDALPLRLYYVQKVHRASSFHRGHSTEVMQAGAELLGAKGMMADLDILTAAFEALAAVKGEPFRIELSHAAIYKALITSLDVDAETAERIRSHIENKSYAALGDELEPYQDREAYRALKAMPTLFGSGEVLEEVARLTDNQEVLDAVSYLQELIEAITAAGFGENVMIDVGSVQEIDYYTGMMIRGYMGGAGSPVLVGGRYDNLCAKFGRDIPATGFAIDIDALSDSVDLKKEITAQELVFCEIKDLKAALDYVHDNSQLAELAPCNTEEEAMQMAKKKGYRTLVIFRDGAVKEMEVRA